MAFIEVLFEGQKEGWNTAKYTGAEKISAEKDHKANIRSIRIGALWLAVTFQ